MYSDVHQISYCESDKSGLSIKTKQNKNLTKKNLTSGGSSGNFQQSFFFGCFFPTWVFNYVKINEIFVLCFSWFHIASKSVGLMAWAQRMLTTSIIFLITSDDKPNLQRYAHYATYRGHPNCLCLNWINCWSVPPFHGRCPDCNKGTFRSKCNHQGYLLRMQDSWASWSI